MKMNEGLSQKKKVKYWIVFWTKLNILKQPFYDCCCMHTFLIFYYESFFSKVRDSDGKYAFIIESSTADYWVNKEPCDLITVGENFNEKSYGFALK